MIETWVAILKWMSRVKLTTMRSIIRNELSVFNDVGWCSVSHTISIVHIVSCWLVNNVIVLYKRADFGTPSLGEIPVRTIVVGRRATHDSLTGAWLLPTLTSRIENVGETGVKK